MRVFIQVARQVLLNIFACQGLILLGTWLARAMHNLNVHIFSLISRMIRIRFPFFWMHMSLVDSLHVVSPKLPLHFCLFISALSSIHIQWTFVYIRLVPLFMWSASFLRHLEKFVVQQIQSILDWVPVPLDWRKVKAFADGYVLHCPASRRLRAASDITWTWSSSKASVAPR